MGWGGKRERGSKILSFRVKEFDGNVGPGRCSGLDGIGDEVAPEAISLGGALGREGLCGVEGRDEGRESKKMIQGTVRIIQITALPLLRCVARKEIAENGSEY